LVAASLFPNHKTFTMRYLSLVILIVSLQWPSSAKSQTFAEWFSQKKTQLKYLAQQIASLQVYAGYLEKGYHVAQQGLTTIGDIKNGEFNLHQAFFSSLSKVNPSVSHYTKVAEIIALQVSIVEQYKKGYKQAQQSGMFDNNEVGYIYNVFTSLLNDCTNDISELITLTTDGRLQLKDDERLQRIDLLYNDMQDKYTFTQSFCNETNVMALSRQKDINDARLMQSMYNIK
jgi:hypothetical protein